MTLNLLISVIATIALVDAGSIKKFELLHKSTFVANYGRRLLMQAHNRGQSAGTEFYLAFMNSHLVLGDTSYSENLTLTVSNPSAQSVHIDISSPFDGFTTRSVDVAARQSMIINISPATIQANYGDAVLNNIVVENKGLYVVASAPVTLVAGNEHTDGGSGDTFDVFPLCQLGTLYATVNDEWPLTGSTNIYTVVATQDNTNITITTPDLNPPITSVLLNRLQTLTYATKRFLLTSSRVRADKPVAVFSGSVCGLGYLALGECDHMVVQLIDFSQWGSVYPLVPLAYADQSEYILLANTNYTQIFDDGVPLVVMQEQHYMRMYYPPILITANATVDIIQVGNRINDTLGDPFMVHVPAVDTQLMVEAVQFNTGFNTYDPSILRHFVRIVTHLSNLGQLRIDDYAPSALLYTRAGRGEWYQFEMPIGSGTHTITPMRADAAYSAIVYGYGPRMAYGFVPAINLQGFNCSNGL